MLIFYCELQDQELFELSLVTVSPGQVDVEPENLFWGVSPFSFPLPSFPFSFPHLEVALQMQPVVKVQN